VALVIGPSLRAERSNPYVRAKEGRVDCFVATLLAMTD
jgi:hypothetical protein